MSLTFDADIKSLIDDYDGKSYQIWNSDTQEIKRLRKTLRDHYLPALKFRCCYCQQIKLERHGLTWDVEHIAPKSAYPQFLFEPKNLAISCKECNIAKGEKNTVIGRINKDYPASGEAFSIIHPHYDVYSDHIEIIKCGSQLTYRVKNGHKGKNTYIMCDLIRFDFSYAEWEDFGDALTQSIIESIDTLGADATPREIKKAIPLVVKLATR